jgi:hypothetical protein
MVLDPDDRRYISEQLGGLKERLRAESQEALLALEERMQARMATKEDLHSQEERLRSLIREEWRHLLGVLQEDFRDKFSILAERMSDLPPRSEFEERVRDRTVHLTPSAPVPPPAPARKTRRRTGGRRH